MSADSTTPGQPSIPIDTKTALMIERIRKEFSNYAYCPPLDGGEDLPPSENIVMDIFFDLIKEVAPQAAQNKFSATEPVTRPLKESAAVTRALAKLNAEARQFIQRGEKENFLWMLWQVFFGVVCQVPYDSPLQYELLSFVYSSATVAGGQWIGTDDTDEAYCCEARDGDPCSPTVDLGRGDRRFSDWSVDGEMSYFEDSCAEHLNIHTYYARTISAHWEHSCPIHRGTYQIIRALEQRPASMTRHYIPELNTKRHQKVLENRVRIACHWVLLTAKPMYHTIILNVDKGNVYSEGTPYVGVGFHEIYLSAMRRSVHELYAESGGDASTPQVRRWWFWTKRFEELGSDDQTNENSGGRWGLPDDLRELCRMAAKLMVEVAEE